MQQRIINGSLPITARLLADDLGLKAHFGADGFGCVQDSTGTKHLYIPNLPAEDNLASALALGGIVHEDGHFSYTDLLLMQSIDNPFLHDLTNVLEDIRIEQCQIKKYAGAKSILAKMIRAMVDTGCFAICPEKDGLADLVFGFMVCELRTKVLQQESLGPNALIASNRLQEMLPGQAFAKLTDMMFTVRDTKSTLEVFNLAKQIIAMLQQEIQDQNKSQPEESTDDNSDDSNGDDQSNNAEGEKQPEAPQENSQADDLEGEDQPENAQGESQPEESQGNGQQDESEEEGQSEKSAEPQQSNSEDSQSESGNPGADQSSGQSGDSSNAETQEDGQSGDSNDQQNQDESGGASNGAATEDNSDLGSSNSALAGEPEPNDQGDVGGDTDDGTEPTSGQSTGELSDAGAQAKAKALAGLLLDDDQSSKKWDTANVIAQTLGERMVESNDLSVRLPDGIPMNRNAGNGEDVLARLRQETNAVRRKTLALLEAQARTKILNGRSGNRLDARRLWKTRTGDARVFEKRVEGHKQDTAIQLLVDRSISMHRRIVLASDAALAVAMAMDGAQGVSTSVAAFPYVGGGQSDDVLVISQFGESFRKTATRFPAIGVDGGTPMAEAMLWGGYNLHSENKERKILVVATDGQPDHVLAAQSVIRQLEASGIEVMAIGIGIDVSGLFRTSAVIQDIRDLPNVLFGMLQEKLAKAA